MNIGAGLYHNIGTKSLLFSTKKPINGIAKASTACDMFVGTAYCLDLTDLSSIGVALQFIMNLAIAIYVSKPVISSDKILSIDIEHKKE